MLQLSAAVASISLDRLRPLSAGGVAALAMGAVVLVSIPALWILQGPRNLETVR